MAEGNGSGNVASVAIIILVIIAIFALYFMFGRGVSADRGIDVDIDVPDKIEQPFDR